MGSRIAPLFTAVASSSQDLTSLRQKHSANRNIVRGEGCDGFLYREGHRFGLAEKARHGQFPMSVRTEAREEQEAKGSPSPCQSRLCSPI